MKIIYHCFGGSHSSVTAAALHLGMLNKTKPPTREQLMVIPYFDKTNENDFGRIKYMGTDEFGHEVYVMGKRSFSNRYISILMGVAEVLGSQDKLVFVNCMDRVNWSMKIGGFTSRRLGIVPLGRPLVTWGTQQAFYQLVNLVEITRLKAIQNEHKAETILL